MQVRIGVVHSPRELEVDVANDDADELTAEIQKTLKEGSPLLWLTDRKGRRVAVVVDKVTYVEIGTESGDRRVGFSAL